MLHRLAILSALLLTACGATPPPTTPDASGDAAPVDVAPVDVAPDAAPDAPPPPDATPPDVAVDAAPDAPVDTAAPDVAPDAPPPTPDGAVDVAADAAADVAPEAARDAAPTDTADAAPDATPCVERATRCVGTSINVVDICIGGVWVRGTCPTTALPTGAIYACTMDVCLACRRDAAGTGCAAEPLCAEDVDCYRLGLGRCVGGRCGRRGIVRCTQNSDCEAWSTSTTSEACVENAWAGAVPIMACGSAARPCNSDAMCPRSYRCDTAAGFCVTP